MSSGSADIKFTADETDVVKAQDKLIKQQQEAIENYKKLVKEAKSGGKEISQAAKEAEKEMNRFAASTMKINRTPVEQYKEEMFKLNAALRAGKIDQETFNRAAAAARTELHKAGEAGKASFGQSALAGVARYAAGVMSVSSAVGILRGAMNLARQETEAAMASVEALVEARRGLMQTGTSAQDIQQQNAFADSLAATYGVSREQARNLVFSARSEGFAGSEKDIMRLAAANVADIPMAITAAGMVRGNFDKKISAMEAVVGTLVGGEVSRQTAEQYAATLPKLSGAVSEIGATPAETMATVAVLATRNERAAEYTATLANRLGIDEQFKGKGIGGAIQSLQAMPKEERQEILGESKEMNMAYSWLAKDLPAIKEVEKRLIVEMADPEKYIKRKEYEGLYSGTYEANLRLSQVDLERSKVRNQIIDEQLLAGGGQQRAKAVSDVMYGDRLHRTGMLSRFFTWGATKWAEAAETPPALIHGVGAYVRSRFDPTASFVEQLVPQMQDMSRTAQAMQTAAETQQQAAQLQLEAAQRNRTTTSEPNYTNAARARQAAVGGAVEAR